MDPVSRRLGFLRYEAEPLVGRIPYPGACEAGGTGRLQRSRSPVAVTATEPSAGIVTSGYGRSADGSSAWRTTRMPETDSTSSRSRQVCAPHVLQPSRTFDDASPVSSASVWRIGEAVASSSGWDAPSTYRSPWHSRTITEPPWLPGGSVSVSTASSQPSPFRSSTRVGSACPPARPEALIRSPRSTAEPPALRKLRIASVAAAGSLKSTNPGFPAGTGHAPG